MNVFEDLIVELKQENLLERTVIDDQRIAAEESFHLDETEVPNVDRPLTAISTDSDSSPDFQAAAAEVELEGYDAHLHETEVPAAPPPQIHKKPRNGQEFYRKRAMSEVSNLQMVEHVLTGVEREYMKVRPRTFDDFAAKKALNTFLQVTENENSNEHKEAEFKLMAETEAWCTALAERDVAIPVSSLRQYCESSRPPLSSQALVALARFYRNLPYTNSVRSKFDFVITRLFSRPAENEMRVALFNHEETLGHIQTLYRDWSSIALYGADDDESRVTITALSFEDLAIEAENASAFDQLIERDFFSNVRRFKEGIGDLFYAPSVLAAAVDANVRIGNAYVKLIDLERQKMDAESIQSKYGDKHDDSVAEGIGRTLGLVDILRSPLNRDVRPPAPPVEEEPENYFEPAVVVEAPKKETPVVPHQRPAIVNKLIESALSMNRWLVGISAVLIFASIGIYIYANYFVVEEKLQTSVRSIEIDDPSYKDFVGTARVSGNTLYGMLLPTWESLSKEKKEEILVKLYQGGKEKGYSRVTLVNKDGKQVGYASASRIDVLN